MATEDEPTQETPLTVITNDDPSSYRSEIARRIRRAYLAAGDSVDPELRVLMMEAAAALDDAAQPAVLSTANSAATRHPARPRTDATVGETANRRGRPQKLWVIDGDGFTTGQFVEFWPEDLVHLLIGSPSDTLNTIAGMFGLNMDHDLEPGQ